MTSVLHHIMISCIVPTAFARNTYVINDGEQTRAYTTYATNPAEVLDRAGVELGEGDIYTTQPVDGVYEIVKYTMSEDGQRVVGSEPLTRGSALNNMRPFVMEDTNNSPLRLLWMNGNYYYWIVNTRYTEGYPTSIRADEDLPKNMKARKGYTFSANVKIDQENYLGDLVMLGDDIVYGVNESQYPYIKVNGVTYLGQNVLGTADSWRTENTATTGGKWFSKTKLAWFNLAISMDGECLTVYRDGIIDMKINCGKTKYIPLKKIKFAENIAVEGKVLTKKKCYPQTRIRKECLVKQLLK